MWCVTNADQTVAQLVGRLREHASASLQEVRLDLLDRPSEVCKDWPIAPGNLLVTCRPVREGGGFDGDETQRIELLERWVATGPGWVDVELSTDSGLRRRLFATARKYGSKVLLSMHDQQPGAATAAAEHHQRLLGEQPDGIKLAVFVPDAAELGCLHPLAKVSDRPAVLLGMGPAGVLSRALYPRFGSAWMYVAATREQATAAGQFSIEQAIRHRLPPGSKTPLFALLGGPQVMTSPGPEVYNQLFTVLDLEGCYLPVVTHRPLDTIELLLALGLRGASVTMPLKRAVIDRMDVLGSEAERAGVVNTLTVLGDGRLRGDLTDGLGAMAALERHGGEIADKTCLILGTGATACAIAHTLVARTAGVLIVGRSRAKADTLAKRVGAKAASLDELAAYDYDVLVHTTPVGGDDPEATLIQDAHGLTGKIVLDAVLATDTGILRQARAQGATAITGRQMWAEQGCRQLRHWFGIEVSAAQLEEFV